MPCRSSTCPAPTLKQAAEEVLRTSRQEGGLECSVQPASRASSRGRRRAKTTKGNHGIPFSNRGQPLSTKTNQQKKVLCWIPSILKQTISRIENGEFLHLLRIWYSRLFVALWFQITLGLASSCCNCSGSRSDSSVLAGHPKVKQRHPMLKCVIDCFFCCIEPPISPRLHLHKAGWLAVFFSVRLRVVMR